jgi:hypothetical protein
VGVAIRNSLWVTVNCLGLIVMLEFSLPLKEKLFDDELAWRLPDNEISDVPLFTFKPLIKSDYSSYKRVLFSK